MIRGSLSCHPQFDFETGQALDIRKHPVMKTLKPHIVRAFWAFNDSHPHTYDMFRYFTEEAYLAGVKRFHTTSVFQRIRWHLDVDQKSSSGQEYKVNDHHAGCYARVLMHNENKFMGIFNLRNTNKDLICQPKKKSSK